MKQITHTIQKYIDEKHIAGAVFGMASSSEIIGIEALGMMDKEEAKPMQTDSIFRVASMTKTVTCVAIMQLYEQGKLKLDDAISKYIPEFTNPKVIVYQGDEKDLSYELVDAKQPISIHHLLNHTSGLTYKMMSQPYIADFYAEAGINDGLASGEMSLADNIKKLAQMPLLFHPNEGWQYGISDDVLGYLIEIITGKSLADYFQEMIFEPLGMVDTSFYLPDSKRSRLVQAYIRTENDLVPTPEGNQTFGYLTYSASKYYEQPQDYFSGGGGLLSTASDFLRFNRMMLNQGRVEDAQILQEKTHQLMTSNVAGDFRDYLGHQVGYGVSLVDKPSIASPLTGIYGWGGFYFTNFWIYPEKDISWIMYTQQFPNDGFDLDYQVIAEMKKFTEL